MLAQACTMDGVFQIWSKNESKKDRSLFHFCNNQNMIPILVANDKKLAPIWINLSTAIVNVFQINLALTLKARQPDNFRNKNWESRS